MAEVTFTPPSRIQAALASFPTDLFLSQREAAGVKSYVSASQLKMADRCLEQLRQRYILGRKEVPSGDLLIGRATHKAGDANYTQKIVTRDDMPRGDVEFRAADAFEQELELEGGPGEVRWKEDEKTTGGDATKAAGEALDLTVKLAGLELAQLAPRIAPISVEEAFTIKVDGLPLPIHGRFDLRAKCLTAEADVPFDDEQNPWDHGVELLIDRKTRGRAGVNGEDILQGRIYQLRVPVPFDVNLLLKQKTPRAVGLGFAFESTAMPHKPMPPESPALTVARITRIMVSIAHCYWTYGPNEPWPGALTHPWACGYCGYRANGCVWQPE